MDTGSDLFNFFFNDIGSHLWTLVVICFVLFL